MPVDQVLEDHVKPYILERFKDADLILLCGSQARVLNNPSAADTAAAPKKNSDYDFILLYPELPEKYPAALFASGWIDVPGQDERVSIDMKIMDFDYLAFHAQHTREIRRFPFLFDMLKDAYPIQDRNGVLPILRGEATRLLNAGPSPLGPTQINETRTQLNTLVDALNKPHSNVGQKMVALETLHGLSNSYLRSITIWDSPLDRHLASLCQALPTAGSHLAKAFNEASVGDFGNYQIFANMVQRNLDARANENFDDSVLFAQDVSKYVTAEEKSTSDRQGAKIMAGQYLARMKDAEAYDFVRRCGLESVLWLTLKKYQCEQMGVSFSYGEDSVLNADEKAGRPILKTLFSAIRDCNTHKIAGLADIILADQGGLKFDYLERIYVEDLARRRETANMNRPKSDFRAGFFKYG
ncbi:hypothetical protein [Micavibrio aeruginosavorus]|uniref:hypothetical protein n=1 Tax=Micavibrio aeruginosavorus TaxID=349221 RepID=UPI003F4ABEA0